MCIRDRYSSTIVGDIADRLPELESRFDVILSWQVFEHVRDMQAAADNCRRYLKPGGRLFAVLSGRMSAIALLNILIPRRLAVSLNKRLLGRAPETMFRAYYDHCTAHGLEHIFRVWGDVLIEPRYIGAGYFRFSRPILLAYLAAENKIARAGYRNLATHYCVAARR